MFDFAPVDKLEVQILIDDVFDLTTGNDITPVSDLTLGTFRQVTDTPPSRPLRTGIFLPDVVVEANACAAPYTVFTVLSSHIAACRSTRCSHQRSRRPGRRPLRGREAIYFVTGSPARKIATSVFAASASMNPIGSGTRSNHAPIGVNGSATAAATTASDVAVSSGCGKLRNGDPGVRMTKIAMSRPRRHTI